MVDHRLRTVARIGLVYLLGRLATTTLFLLAAEVSTHASRFGASPNIADFVLGWDAQWYWYVAYFGYPSELPLTAAGHVAENAWAFMPVYAYLAEGLGMLLGSWGAGALVISLVAGFLAALALYRLLRGRIGSDAALWGVIFFSSGPLAALFQVGYAESLFLLLLFLALDAVIRRRFLLAYPLLLVMAYTRPGILAFALFLGLYGIVRWWNRHTDPLPVSHIAHIIGLGALCTAAGFSWPLIADAVTGQSGAYLATELAWRRNWGAGTEGFIPFEGWVRAAEFWFELWGLPAWLGIVGLVVFVAGAAWLLLLSRPVVALGYEIRLWSAAYLVYLLAVFFPQSSVFRLLVPLSPLWGAVAAPTSRRYRYIIVGVCLALQWLWIYSMYAMGNTFWQIP